MNPYERAIASEMEALNCSREVAEQAVIMFRPELRMAKAKWPKPDTSASQDNRLGLPNADRPGHDGERAKQKRPGDGTQRR